MRGLDALLPVLYLRGIPEALRHSWQGHPEPVGGGSSFETDG
jgi:hypothetical protein